MDISKKISFKTFYNQYTEISKKDNKDIYLLRSKNENNLLYQEDFTLLKQIDYFNKIYLPNRNLNEEIYLKVVPNNYPNKIVGFFRISMIKKKDIFSWESLIVSKEAPPWFAIDIIITSFNFAFNFLNKKFCAPWTVPKEGNRVKSLHLKLGFSKIIDENKKFYFFNTDKDIFNEKLIKFKSLKIGQIHPIQ
jgi:hypothetical protein